MPPLVAVCRTCDVRNSNELYELDASTLQAPNKTYWELLTELTKVDLKRTPYADKLPTQICSACRNQLRNAYDFVLQVRQTQDKQLKALIEASTNAQSNVAELDKVKLKFESKKSLHTSMQGISEDSLSDECLYENKILDPLTMLDDESSFPGTSSEDEPEDLPLQVSKEQQVSAKEPRNFMCNICPAAYHMKKHLVSHMRKHLPEEEWFDCTHCERKFCRKDNLRKHLRYHGICNDESPTIITVSRQTNAVDVNLCKPHGNKLVQCMICLGKFSKFGALIRHLREHIDHIFLSSRMETLHELAASFYSADIDPNSVTEKQLAARIRKDLQDGNFSYFYSITNEVGYELTLDSSETESDPEVDALKILSGKNGYNCEICLSSFLRKYQLFEHQRVEHDWQDAAHICVRCNARFINQQLFEYHCKSQCKNTQKRFICKRCPIRFRWKHNYKAHIDRVHGNPDENYECTKCKRTFTQKRSLTVHMLTDHADQAELMACQWCNRKFYRRENFFKHLKCNHRLDEKQLPAIDTLLAATAKANGPKIIMCKVCNLKFQKISQLRAHLLRDTATNSSEHFSYNSPANYSITNVIGYEMDLDESETENEEDQAGSSSTSKRAYNCEICQEQCARRYQLMLHQLELHRYDNLPNACRSCTFRSANEYLLIHHLQTQCQNTDKKWICDKCNFRFMWPENLELHRRLQHEMNNTMDPLAMDKQTSTHLPLPPATNDKSLECKHCKKIYLRPARLSKHIQIMHQDDRDETKRLKPKKKYLCTLCGLEAETLTNLTVHMRRHNGEKPYKCSECEKAFVSRSSLVYHSRIHTGERPYRCNLCYKDFIKSHSLNRHMLTHNGLLPHKCTQCDDAFRYSHELKRHMREDHTPEQIN